MVSSPSDGEKALSTASSHPFPAGSGGLVFEGPQVWAGPASPAVSSMMRWLTQWLTGNCNEHKHSYVLSPWPQA